MNMDIVGSLWNNNRITHFMWSHGYISTTIFIQNVLKIAAFKINVVYTLRFKGKQSVSFNPMISTTLLSSIIILVFMSCLLYTSGQLKKYRKADPTL